MEVKYTSDGKKVAIVGKLNAQETIVQEIFIVGENEIPSGENFVVKSLHDAPAISWKEKEAQKIEKDIKSLQDQYSKKKNEYEKAISDLNIKSKSVFEQTAWLNKLAKIEQPILNQLFDFLSGEVKYIVNEGYAPSITPFNEEIAYTDYRWSIVSYEGLKLLTLFGRPDGSLVWRINRYSDGSGSNTEISAHKSLESAKERLKHLLIENGLTDDKIKIAKQHDIELPEELLKEHTQKIVCNLQKTIEDYENKIAQCKEQQENLLK